MLIRISVCRSGRSVCSRADGAGIHWPGFLFRPAGLSAYAVTAARYRHAWDRARQLEIGKTRTSPRDYWLIRFALYDFWLDTCGEMPRSMLMIRAAFEIRRRSVPRLCLYAGDPANSARRTPWEPAISSAALSPIMIDAAFVLPLTIFGMTLPILHVEQRW